MFLPELIYAYFEYKEHSTKENEVNIDCPFCIDNGHSPDKEQKLGINVVTEIAHCHRCDWRSGGRALYYALADEVNVHDNYETDRADLNTTVEKPKRTEFKLSRTKLPKEFEPLWEGNLDTLGKKALKYLTDRGISHGQIKRHKIGFAGAGKYGYRIILPIFYKGATVGFTARTFCNTDLKYLISDGEKFLYNYPRKGKRQSRCILLEGPFDVLNVERRISHYDCIGRQGSALTELQLRALSKYEEIIIWPDPDQPGIEGAINIAKTLKDETQAKLFGIHVRGMVHDPGDATEKEIRQAIKSIKPWTPALENRLLVSVLF